MSKTLKDGRMPIVLNEKTYHLLCSLNVIDCIQGRFGSMDKLSDALNDEKYGIRNLRWVLTIMLNEGKNEDEDELSEKEVGKLIHTKNFKTVKNAVHEAFFLSTPDPDEDQESDSDEDQESDPDEDEKSKNM